MQHFNGEDKTVCPDAKWTPKVKFKPRHNQKEVVDETSNELKDSYGCLIEAKTAFGKTVTALQVAAKMKTKVIVVVDQDNLLEQWKNTYETFFEGKVGIVKGNSFDVSNNLTIATSQTLYSRLESFPEDFWKSFGMVIVDEGHVFACDTFFLSINNFHARYRLAVSATWRRKDQLDKLWGLSISDTYVKGVRTDDLKRYYAVREFRAGFDEISYMSRTRYRTGLDFNKILSTLAQSEKYNDYLVKMIVKQISKGRNVLLACKRVSQIEILDAKLKNIGIESGIYTGKFHDKTVKKKELEEAIEKNPILATFKKVEKGTDIPKLDCLIIASPIRDQEQLIGRVTREYPDKEFCVVVDIRFPEIVYLNGQNRDRDKMYKKLGWEKVNLA